MYEEADCQRDFDDYADDCRKLGKLGEFAGQQFHPRIEAPLQLGGVLELLDGRGDRKALLYEVRCAGNHGHSRGQRRISGHGHVNAHQYRLRGHGAQRRLRQRTLVPACLGDNSDAFDAVVGL